MHSGQPVHGTADNTFTWAMTPTQQLLVSNHVSIQTQLYTTGRYIPKLKAILTAPINHSITCVLLQLQMYSDQPVHGKADNTFT